MLSNQCTKCLYILLFAWILLSEIICVIISLWSDYGKAGLLAKEYASTKGPGATAKPHDHLFFRKLSPIVQRTLDKCVRENGFM